jgi:hypothetical protein
MGVFTFLSILAIGLASLYNKNGKITGGDYDQIAQFSLGNLGEAAPICVT